MDAKTLTIVVFVLAPVIIDAWQSARSPRELRSDIHYHSKRHMLPRDDRDMRHEGRKNRRTTTQRTKELRKKPSGHLRPLQEDDIENDEVVSVAIGPPSIRPKFDKFNKQNSKSANQTTANGPNIPTNLVKDVLVQLGREFLTHQVNEDFVFGQYVGNCMRNLTNELRLRMQHEILDLIVKYQRLRNAEGNINPTVTTKSRPLEEINTQSTIRGIRTEKRFNETDEVWPDFSNLANIVG